MVSGAERRKRPTNTSPIEASGSCSAESTWAHASLSNREPDVRTALLRGVGAVAGIAAVLLLATGCRADPTQSVQTVTTAAAPTPAHPTRLLTSQDIDRYPRTSVQHALLASWRAAQFADYAGYRDGF